MITMPEQRITKKDIEKRLQKLAIASKIEYKLRQEQFNKYNVYVLEIKLTDIGNYAPITEYLKSAEMLGRIDTLILFANYIKQHPIS